jgi:hypothetical protein
MSRLNLDSEPLPIARRMAAQGNGEWKMSPRKNKTEWLRPDRSSDFAKNHAPQAEEDEALRNVGYLRTIRYCRL